MDSLAILSPETKKIREQLEKLHNDQEEEEYLKEYLQKLKKEEEEAHKNDPDVHIGDGNTKTFFTPKLRLNG